MNCMTVRCCGEGSVSLRDLVYFSICLSIVHTGWVEGGKWRLPAGRWSSVVTLRVFCCPLSRQVVFTSWIRYNEAGFLRFLLFSVMHFSCFTSGLPNIPPSVERRRTEKKREEKSGQVIMCIYYSTYV